MRMYVKVMAAVIACILLSGERTQHLQLPLLQKI